MFLVMTSDRRVSPTPCTPPLTCYVCLQGPLPFDPVSSPSSSRSSTSWARTLSAMTSRAGSTGPSPTSQPWTPHRCCSSPKGEPGRRGLGPASPLGPCCPNNSVMEGPSSSPVPKIRWDPGTCTGQRPESQDFFLWLLAFH